MMSEVDVLYSKLIESIDDIIDANIIDFNRTNGNFSSKSQAYKTIFSWFNKTATLTKVRINDFWDAPKQPGWEEWLHRPFHSRHNFIGEKYYHWFKWKHPSGTIVFSDSPDFWGQLENNGPLFWGDIGQVSCSAFAFTQKCMGVGDIWVSVVDDGNAQVIIESSIPIWNIWCMTSDELDLYISELNQNNNVLLRL